MAYPIKLIKEIDLQSKCKEAIIELGGFSMKMSNRFLVGVPDLLCQLPSYMTSFWEIKTANSMHWERQPSPLTPNQKIWLRKLQDSGGFGGVIHFVMLNELYVAIYPTSRFPYREVKEPWFVYKKDLIALPRGCKFQPFKDNLIQIHEEQARQRIIGEQPMATFAS